jgi:hypothetical protein
LAVALVGVAHTKVGRPLLGLMGAGCPVDLDGVDPARVESHRQQELGRQLGELDALSHPALEFVLGETSRAEVEAWRQRSGAECQDKRGGSALECTLAAPDNVFLQFDDGRLVALDAFTTTASAEQAMAEVAALRDRLVTKVGVVSAAYGARSADELGARTMAHAAVEFRYRRYLARVTATNFGSRGFRVRQQYQWLPDSKQALN